MLAAGDHSLTALAIGRMLGIAGNGIVFTGPELDRLTSDALRALVKECNVFARASPENKLKIVRALQVHTVTAGTYCDCICYPRSGPYASKPQDTPSTC